MKSVAIALTLLFFNSGTASADEVSPPKTTATRPAKDLPGQTSVPSTTPPATRTETTGAVDQDAATKRMNEDAKKKLEIEGK